MKVSIAQLNPVAGNIPHNLSKALAAINKASVSSDVIVFSELFLCGYFPGDLLFNETFKKSIIQGRLTLIEASKKYPELNIVMGLPTYHDRSIFNSIEVFRNGKSIACYHKQLLAQTDVFNEHRYFSLGTSSMSFDLNGHRYGVLICEDIWSHENNHTKDPINEIKKMGIQTLLIPMASPFEKNKFDVRLRIIKTIATKLNANIITVNQVGAQDDLIYDGNSLVINNDGDLLEQAASFKEQLLTVDINNRVPSKNYHIQTQYDTIFQAIKLGISDYFEKNGFKKAVLGLSGGIDSAVVAVLLSEAIGAQNLSTYMLHTQYTSSESINVAKQLALNLGCDFKSINIQPSVDQLASHFSDNDPSELVEQNLQARLRGNLLMGFSNQQNSLLVTTGNKSELAVGYATIYGDMCGALSPIGDLLKTEVYALANYINQEKEVIPSYIIKRAPSAELTFNQTDQDSLPSYEILDQLLDDLICENIVYEDLIKKYDDRLLVDIIKKIKCNEYKRLQYGPILKMSKKCFGKGRVIPITHGFNDYDN